MLDILNRVKHTESLDIGEPTIDDGIRKRTDYIFLFFVGSMYVYSLIRAVVSATFISIAPSTMYFMAVVALGVISLIFYNKKTILVSVGLLGLTALVVTVTLDVDNIGDQHTHFYEVFLMMTGRLSYRPELGRTIVWILTFAIGLFVKSFMYGFFTSFALTSSGLLIMLILWVPGFSRDEVSVLFFLAAMCIVLVRKMTRSVNMGLVAAPIIIGLVMVVQLWLPAQSEMYTRRNLADLASEPINAIGDFIYELVTPVHFTFQSTGFSGAGGRLGGPVTPNNRSVMTVNAPGNMYLAGAVSNTFTGNSWISNLEEGAIYTHGLKPSHFEMLETAVAMIRRAGVIDTRDVIPLSAFDITPNEMRYIERGFISTLGVQQGNGHITDFYVHAYLPMQTVTIAMGANRTGTIFRPPRLTNLWFYPGGPDYTDVLTTSPGGDIFAPRFMSRGTIYHMQSLNVRTQLQFIDDLLHTIGYGTYRADEDEVRFLGVPANLGPAQRRVATIHETAVTASGNPARNQIVNTTFARPISTASNLDVHVESFGVSDMTGLLEDFMAGRNPSNMEYIRHINYLDEWLAVFERTVLAQYAEQVRANFLTLPDSTTDRVRELTLSIVDGIEGDFARAIAIRNFLLSEFPYTLTPAFVPRNVDFVDFFLFEGQEGYCTYFASAMAVMARIAGIPSRYVEGFVLPPQANPFTSFVVTNRMAHAWVEVYIEGFGWVVMEATPTYALLMEQGAPTPLPAGLSIFVDDPEWWEWMYGEWEIDISELDFTGDWVTGSFQAPNLTEETDGFTITVAFIRMFVIFLAVAFVFGFVLFMFIRTRIIKNKLRRVKNLPPGEQVKVYFKGIMEIVNWRTKPFAAGETPKAFGLHSGKRFAFQSDSVFLRDLIDIYYKAKYSPHSITAQELATIEEAYYDMISYMRQMKSHPKYLYLRYVKLIGAV